MSNLNSLKNLIHKLKREEVKSLYRFLEFNSERGDQSPLKTSQLVDLIMDNKNYTSIDLQKTIYGKENSVAFNKLVNRLYDKVLEVIILDLNLHRGYYSERAKKVFELRKKMIQIDLLNLKGLKENLASQIDKVIEQARVFEIYDILIQALYSKQRFSLISSKSKNVESLKKEIHSAERCWNAFNLSQSIFNDMMSKINNSSGGYEYKEELKLAVATLKLNFHETNSPTIGYNYFILATELEQKENRFNEAGIYLDQLLKITERNKSIYNGLRLGSALLNIANNMIHLFKLDEAKQYIDRARTYFVDQPINLLILSEIEFYLYYYNSDLINARTIISKLVSVQKNPSTMLLLSKWNYLMANQYFCEYSFDSCLSYLNSTQEIKQDKEGWNFQKRILTILSRIEMKDSDSADLNIQSLDKFMKRITKSKFVRPRYILIVRILRKLINENFDFKKVYLSRKKYFDLLSSKDLDYCWEIKSPELIIFQEWFRANMQGKRYNQESAMKNISKQLSI